VLPLPEERLDRMFSPSGRKLAWGIGAMFALGPLAVLLCRRADFEPLTAEP
jgi:hypothetical protein